MKPKLRRIVASVLTACFLLTMTTPAFAVEADNQTNVEEQEEEYRIFVKVGENNLFFFISSQPTDGQPGTVSVQQPIVDESGKFPDIAPYKGSVIIPDTIEYEGKQYTVTKIGGAAFYGSEVTEVSIPDTVTEIGGEAFMSCGNLSSVTFRDNSALESIGVNAFSGCQKLTSLNLPDSLIKIGDRAFAYCVNLNELDIPDNVTEIGSTAFGNTGIEKLVIPAGVTNGVVAALQSYDPARVSFAEGSPYKIDDGIVYSGTVLEGALDKDITEVTVLDGTTAIAENAFDSCASLEKVVFPDSLKEIRYQAFSQCTSLAEADLPSALTTIGQEAFTKTKLSRVVIPEGVTEIPRGAFSNVSSLKTVVIPGTVTDIGENAFSGITGDASGKNFIMQNATATTFNEYAFGSTGNGKKKKPVVPDQLTVIIPEGSEDSYTVENYILKKYLTDESGAIKKGVTYGLSLKDTSMALKAAEATTGGSLTLKAAIPIDAEVDCKSDNSEAATVEYKDGKIVVTGVSKGAATISVKLSLDGVTLVEDSCTVTVTDEGVVVPDVKESVTNTDAITDANDKAIAASAATSVTAQDTLREAANEEAAKITDSEQQQLLAKAEEQGLTGDNVKLYTQTYLDIEAKAVEKNESTGDVTSITLDITPKMQVVASTATNSADIKIDGTDKNAVVVKTAEPLTISGDSEITVKLPSNFAEKLVYIKHGAKNGTYFYKSTADKNGTLTFTSTHGFSPFTFSLTNEAVAEVGDTGYATLEAALDAAKDGDTVTVLKDKLTATMSGDSRTVTLKNGTGDEITVTINGKDYTIAAGETVDVTYSQPSTGPAVYAIAVDKADHGTVAVNPTKAAKGKTVTITATPDAGYAVDAVSVTDRKGKAVKVTANSDGTYSFTMPASKVDVSVSFKQKGEEPTPPVVDNPFTDVAKDAYYYDAVLWAVDNKITNGTSATTFSPALACTRAQMICFLWNQAGQPAPKGDEMPFTDVLEGTYYHDAIQWAVEEGLAAGTSSTTFSPNATLTRAQTVTFLWRAAGEPAVNGDTSFTDVADGAYYSDAVAWAVQNGVTNGTSATTFSPDNDCTRGQIVTFLYRAAGN